MKNLFRSKLFALLSAGILIFSACVSEPARMGFDPDGGLKIATTTAPIYSLTSHLIEGTDAQIVNILPPNASPHTYQLTFESAKTLASADVLIKNGLELEMFLEDALDDFAGRLVVASEGIDLIKNEDDHHHDNDHDHDHDHDHDDDHDDDHDHDHDHHNDHDHDHHHDHDHDHGHDHHHDHDHDHDDHHDDDHNHDHDHHNHDHHHDHDHHHHHHHGEFNSHVWLSPQNGIIMAQNILNVLVEEDPENADLYNQNFQTLESKLQDLHEEVQSRLDALEIGNYIVFHDAYVYFDRDFGIGAVAVMEEFPGKEPSARYLAELIETITTKEVGVIFTEPQFSPKIVNTLAQDYDLQIAELDPAGKYLSKDIYFDMILGNVSAFESVFPKKQEDGADSAS